MISSEQQQRKRGAPPSSATGAFLAAALLVALTLSTEGKLSPDTNIGRNSEVAPSVDVFRRTSGPGLGSDEGVNPTEEKDWDKRGYGRGFTSGRRAEDLRVNGPESGKQLVSYDLALRSSIGTRLGQYVAGTSELISLSFGQNAIVSSRADLGNYFYTDSLMMLEIPGFSPCTSGSTCEQVVTATSLDMPCYCVKNQIMCYLYNTTSAKKRLPISSVFTPVAARLIDASLTCTSASPVGCFGSALTVSRRAVAVVRGTPGKFHVSTFFLQDASSNWTRTSGDATYELAPSLLKFPTTRQISVSMSDLMMAIGDPTGLGRVRLLLATGVVDETGYGPHRTWSLVADVLPDDTTASFGTSVSLGPKFLVVGAPGNSTHAARIAVYRPLATGAPILFCIVRHTAPTKDSRMGFSVAQMTSGADTLVMAGAPGENLVYTFLVRETAGTCTRLEVLGPDPSDPSILDEFGYSVTFAGYNALIGSPGYQRYWKPNVDGLIYGYSFCPPGWVLGVNRPMRYGTEKDLPVLVKMCNRCGPSETSDGGRASTCTKCAVAIPPRSTLDYGCSFKCDLGYFGTACQVCSVEKTNAPKPANSHWKDGVSTCDWECDGGYILDYFTNGTSYCKECVNKIVFGGLQNVAWILPTCEYGCKFGYFRDPRPQIEYQTDNNCYDCTQISIKTGASLPVNAEFMNGLDVCIFGPKIGFECSSSVPGATCTACPAIPPNANFIDTNPTKALSRCNFACKTNFFGHPAVPGVCVSCADLMQTQGAPLPKNGYWPTSPAGNVCNSQSWECAQGLSKSNLTDYCCPMQSSVARSHPDPTYSPCQYACDLGYRWIGDTSSCFVCPALRANAQWELDCNYTCTAGFYGKAEFDSCDACSTYRQKLRTPVPLNGYFPDVGTACGPNDWVCIGGYTQALDASPPGCCPVSLPTETATKVLAGQRVGQCGYKCKFGYGWDAVKKGCSACPSNPGAPEPPPFSEWDGYNCTHVCMQGYVQTGSYNGIPELKCTDCSLYASSTGWALPANGRWPNSSELVGTCDSNAWTCLSNYGRNFGAKLCCLSAQLPSSQIPQHAVWNSTGCTWLCSQGYFPPKLSSSETACMTCPNYLDGVPSCVSGCDGQVQSSNPTECSVSVQVTYKLNGVALSTFSDAARRAFIDTLAKATGKTSSLSEIAITGLLEVGSRREGRWGREGSLSIGAALQSDGKSRGRAVTPSGKSLQVSAQVNMIAPYFRINVENSLRDLSPLLKSALAQVGLTAEVSVLFAPTSIKGPGTFTCGSQYSYNDLTNRCCIKETFTKPPSDPSRYLWLSNGCDWACRSTYKGADCLTCTEYKSNLWKPDGSVWDDTSPTCTFKCVAGYIKSDTGTSCISLQTLVKMCAASSRCADCTQLADCVWCKDKCVPGSDILSTGVRLYNGFGCAYLDASLEAKTVVQAQGGFSAGTDCVCSAAKTTCTGECQQYKDCSTCLQDQYCGWCSNETKCMLGSHSSPLFEKCSGVLAWKTGPPGDCNEDVSLWVIGLVCACTSSLLVGGMCCYFMVRVRIAAREAQAANAQSIRFGAGAVPAGGAEQAPGENAHDLVQRFLVTFPTFKFSEERARDNSSATAKTTQSSYDMDGDDELVCTICLGTFCNGEECRMLPCLHVFHMACIDQWLGVSQECPLCKQSVLGKNDQSEKFALATRRLAGAVSMPRGADEVGEESTELAV